jgi:hypothetical protein
MPHTTCAHCGTAIKHHESLQESAGKTFCCRNCLAMASGAASEGTGQPFCAHCESAIVDQTTAVHRGSQTFCCENCADAVSTAATHP